MTIQELRAQVGKELGFGHFWAPFDGSPAAFSELSAQEQADLTNAMLAYIRGHPTQFTPEQVAQASTMRNVQGPDTSSNVGVFVDEVAAQAESLNPFSQQNRATLYTVVIAVTLIGALAYAYAKGGGSITINKGGPSA